MKIMICSSMSFATNMREMATALRECGHEPLTTEDLDYVIANPHITADLDADRQHCIENNIFRNFMDSITKSDALLVLNYDKNGIKGYIGASTLMELAVGYYLKKKLYLLNPLPSYHEVRWAHEVSILQPTVINGDIRAILSN